MPESKFEVVKDLGDGLHFVEGKRCTIEAEKTFPVFEPRSGKIVAQCPISDAAEVDRVVNIAAKAQPEWGNTHVFERAKVLREVAKLIRENLDALARWEVLCNGKPIYEARVDLESSAETFDFYAGAASTVLSTGLQYELPGGPQQRFAYSRREPYGVVGAIGAWNYPFQTAVWKVAPALAAGNAVVYKPSPFAPLSPVVIGELLTAAGLPSGVFNVIQGEAETGQALCKHEKVKKVSFTGSVATGKAIQRACAENNIKPVTLELGGKSPLIIFEDSDIGSAVSAAMLANFLNQGQVCTNATRVFVQKSIVPQFTEALLKEADAKLKVGDPLKEETRVGASINEQHLKKVLGFVESAKQEGATVLRGGKRVHPEGVEEGFYFEPAIISDLSDSMKIVRDEIFGAVLLILPFENEDEVVKRANDTGYGLATGVFSRNLARGHRIASKLQAGTVFINTYNDTDVHVPFGGFKESGHGRENCVEALHAFTQIKAVYVNVEDKLDHCFH
ncbi:hypothetical protein QR680_012281 [Steinernema hermaphroditum]|uniref:Aldehyde dehydrogenase domain-containing protein n=1 Tax=Steinernema hermaphroditum TaxID=289476 RepID=A0AA39LZK7_9BILA|nr:hypothetical protein QR680_012281 [Steinernema hermaphroditum]